MKGLSKGEVLHYIPSTISSNQSRNEKFEEILSYLKMNCIEDKFEYYGDFYTKNTYKMPDGGEFVYVENDGEGVPYSITCVEPSPDFETYKDDLFDVDLE